MSKSNRIGRYVAIKVPGESYKAYLPSKLSPKPFINLNRLYFQLDKAMQSLVKLNSVTENIPNTALFIYMYVRKEALLSSQIEGTQSSFSDLILFENHQNTNISLDDVEEVFNYVMAIHHGLKRLKNGFPMSLRLIREIHEILLKGGRGSQMLPGEFRRSQNWVGGTRPGNALYVPPPPEHLIECLDDFEKFLQTEEFDLPILIKVGLAHVQFETIHPFLDGNGRLGRLLIILLLCEKGILNEPILYLSLYLKQNRKVYYDLLQEVRTEGAWETWLEFFLEGIHKSADKALNTAKKINEIFDEDLAKIETLGRAKFSCIKAFEHLKKLPQISVPLLARTLNIAAPTARSSLSYLTKLGILEEVSGKKRDKIYIYRKYLDILQEGAEPL